MPRMSTAVKQTATYPLSQALRHIKRSSLADRNHIISPELCDDTIQRLAHSLKDYAGCDVIDINPGVSLWSSKIHQLLKPRRHILVEPHADAYDQSLRPLVDAEGSKYTLADFKHGHGNGWSLRNYVANGLLPEQAQRHGSSSPDRNTTLLVIANMSRQPRPSGPNRTSMRSTCDSHFKALEHARALAMGSGFHTNGPVRMLMWLSDNEKTTLVPRSIFHRKRLSIYCELFGHVEEVVGDVLGPHAIRREATLEMQSCILAAERMERHQIYVPTDRLDSLPKRLRVEGLQAVKESSESSSSAIHGERDWHKELNDLRRRFEDGTYSQFLGGPPGYDLKRRPGKTAALTPEYKEFRRLQRTETNQRNKKSKVDEVLMTDAEVRAKHLAIATIEPINTEERDRQSEELNRLITKYRKQLDSLSEKELKQVHFFADDRAAWSGESSLLQWDHRSAEPIIPRADEFHHAKPLALLDFQPRRTTAHNLTGVQQQYLDAMLLTFFTAPGNSVVNALDTLAPGAAHALLPNAPSLRDPRKRGRRDLDQLRVRALTPLMLQELAIAFDSWLFKPSLGEMSRTIPWVDRSEDI
ncbi:hypothetical protein MMC13_005792 [Lambiella insularis]|nr:hypothetical protein [Lambiella insularis]